MRALSCREAEDYVESWALLAGETTGFVGELALDGTVSQIGRHPVRLGAVDFHGRNLYEFWPAAFVDDRIAAARRVLAHGRPTLVLGMIHGRWTRCLFAPMRDRRDEPRRVFFIARRVTDPRGHWGPPAPTIETVLAGMQDFGELAALTDTELEALRLMGRGLDTQEMSRVLHRSVKTVEWRRFRIGQRLGCSTRLELVELSMQSGLAFIDDEDFAAVVRSPRLAKDWAPPREFEAIRSLRAPSPWLGRPRPPTPSLVVETPGRGNDAAAVERGRHSVNPQSSSASP